MAITMREKFKAMQASKEKVIVSSEDASAIREEAKAAEDLLISEDYKFFREYLTNIQESIKLLFVKNRIKKVTESVVDNAGVTKTLEITKEEQANELSGQYKLIDQIFTDLQNFANMPKQLDNAIETGKVEVQDNSEG